MRYIGNILHPFGMLLVDRKWDVNYRYGFNGTEIENEIYSIDEVIYSFEYRMYDSRIGKFFSVDPLTYSYPFNSPYAFAENRVIDGTDLEGLEWETTKIYDPITGITYISTRVLIKVVDNSEIVNELNRQAFMAEMQRQFRDTYDFVDIEAKTIYSYTLDFEFVDEDCHEEEGGIFVEMLDETLCPTIPSLSNSNLVANNNGKVEYIGDVNSTATQDNYIWIKFSKIYLDVDGKVTETRLAGGVTSIELLFESVALTLCHELGHSAGLRHPDDLLNDVEDISSTCDGSIIQNNIMNTNNNSDFEGRTGNDTTIGQQKKIIETISTQQNK